MERVGGAEPGEGQRREHREGRAKVSKGPRMPSGAEASLMMEGGEASLMMEGAELQLLDQPAHLPLPYP